jgi:hypothetical protein
MSAVPSKAKSVWQKLKHDKPGQRFQHLHEARRKDPDLRLHSEKWVNLSAGAGIAIVGLVMMPAPGPGIPIFLVGLALLATELHAFAALLDRTELLVRSWFGSRRKRVRHK